MAGSLSNKGWRPPRKSSVGDLRHRVTVQRPDESTRDESGQVVPVWADVATVWARVEPVGGRELMASQVNQADVTHRVIVRHRGDLTPKHRLIWATNANRVLNVVTVLPTVGTGNSLEVLCKEET